MRIAKGVTPNFDRYIVHRTLLVNKKRTFWEWVRREQPTETLINEIHNVIEADDDSGLVVQHVTDRKEHPVYTNGKDDIVVTNEVKVLLLVPPIRVAFLKQYRPKVISSYMETLRITYNGPSVGAIPKENLIEVSEEEARGR